MNKKDVNRSIMLVIDFVFAAVLLTASIMRMNQVVQFLYFQF